MRLSSLLAGGAVVAACVALLLRPSQRLSVVAQALTYFARPHSGIPTSPLVGPHVWRGTDLDAAAWRFELTPPQLSDIAEGVARVRSLGIPMGRLSRADCRFPGLATQFEAWRNATLPGAGLGFAVISGLLVDPPKTVRHSSGASACTSVAPGPRTAPATS